MATLVHKANSRSSDPLVSLVLLDWECRERFHSLDWLNRQDAPRDQYEIIWVELFNRVVPAAMELADVVITCRQKGLYHKHHGYNIGLLQAHGAITVICDSDAIYPPGFISSILAAFKVPGGTELKAMVLMYYQWRSNHTYPDGFSDVSQLQQYEWRPLLPNAGACVCMRTVDSLRFGGFDEHRSLRGYLCGPYELGWRLVNAGLPEIWHDEAMASWHFQHPEPLGLALSGFSRRRWREVAYPHVDHHALTAVEAFSSGRLLPLKENAEVHARRMALRRIGTKFEEKYATMTGPQGFTRWQWLRMHLKLLREGQTRTLRAVRETGPPPAVAIGAAGRASSGPDRAADVAVRARPRAAVAWDVAVRAGPRAAVARDVAVRAGPRAAVARDVAVRAGPRAAVASDVAVRARPRAAVARDAAVRAGPRAAVAADAAVRSGPRT